MPLLHLSDSMLESHWSLSGFLSTGLPLPMEVGTSPRLRIKVTTNGALRVRHSEETTTKVPFYTPYLSKSK
ncbi:hypothetical protein CBS147343_8960 [Aspergillus niger]|nr:hypothetical protein CBS133816_10430 [Aspergillus niger]KAI2842437.1 hypothetical protein CBS12448_10250 [Aspergillus niger]KAI2916580.1 hypothetical protein CBS147371_5134 [Aspergillus niger]KAI2922712.1 hypothetical protein CBS147320_7267 [Aspergillus niger]KAI2958737.1 hypothetical protein CBS147324_10482 [Aspergillus niger]